ncbi:hypothetical protein PIROE2DRAFT_19233 [Piromyces sp. E2]|nr:hypothetical protein PIROE2DRAFT_19233 [Piromyces sp. E2]|eukprot:OUM56240.1 hypothetical protein PIROE2DRAFT_19233 [Piromyces sp. E2]
MSVIFSTVQSILNNILQDLEIQNLTNHLKFETLPYFSQIRAITKPELSTFDSDQEVQKVETSHLDNIIVSTYGMVDNSMTNEVFKRKNGFKSRINSYVNPLPKIKEEMNDSNNNPSVFFMDDLIDMYGLSDESILFELANLEHEEELNRIKQEVMNSHSSITSEEKSYTNSNSSLNSQSTVSHSHQNISNNNSESITNIDQSNSPSQSYVVPKNNNHTKSNVRIDESYNNIIPSNNNLSYSTTEMNKSTSNQQSQESNSNEELNKSGSYDRQSQGSNDERDYSGSGSGSRSQSFSESYQSQSQESFSDINNNDNNSNNDINSRSQSIISASNSVINAIDGYFMNPLPDPVESVESIHENALIFPEVADGQTLEIIKNNDFQNLLEEILESTIFNILQEANAGEFDLTKKPAFCYYKTYNNCKNIIGSQSSINITTNPETTENPENPENPNNNNNGFKDKSLAPSQIKL